MGFESEFILLKSTSPIDAVNYHGWSNSPALPSGSVEAQVLQEIAVGVMKSGIELQMYHAEAAPGQVRLLCRHITHDTLIIIISSTKSSPDLSRLWKRRMLSYTLAKSLQIPPASTAGAQRLRHVSI